MRVKLGGSMRYREEAPGAAITPKAHRIIGEIVTGVRPYRQIPLPPPEPPADHVLTPRTLVACRDAISFGSDREQEVGRAVIELGSVKRAAEDLGITDVRVYQLLRLTKAA